MLIAHISDMHVFADAPESALVRLDAAQAARKIVADVAAHEPAFDAVVLTGDLADGGSAADYALIRDILAPLQMPVFAVPGNHDTRAGLRAAFAGTMPFGPGPTLDYEAQVGGMRLLALDTLVEGHVHGALTPAQIDWLAGRLAVQVPTIIAMHHPPFPSGVPTFDTMALVDGRAEMGRLVADFHAPLVILTGHIHRPFHALWQGALCQVGGGPAFQQALDLRPDAPEPARVDEPYAYFIVHQDPQTAMVIHKRYVAL
ncbi:metallophosphoesterase [Roseobacter sp.]|uniref:metallophosphoesterase n=1 Tax=Roseobacter sp. TaxID=1907202 RepID=UPI003299EB1C